MKNLVCFSHPKYEGQGAPLLSCKTCCSIYIGYIKELQAEQQRFNANEWLAQKSKIIIDQTERMEKAANSSEGDNQVKRGLDFFPGSI